MSCLENGRIYATLQNADFKGNTKESNQPFHPQNSRELQQAMLNMMHGRAFNISLTSNELLTLSNLRVLMEYAPDEPEVNILYQLIMKIEELNLTGRQEPDQLYGRSERKERECPEAAYRLCQVVHWDVTGSRYSAIHIQHAMRNL